MVISPDRKDFSVIFNMLGRLILGLSFFMLIPIVVSILKNEIGPLYDFIIGFAFSATIGFLFLILFPVAKEMNWLHAFFTVSLGWLAFSLLGAVPLFLTSHFLSAF